MIKSLARGLKRFWVMSSKPFQLIELYLSDGSPADPTHSYLLLETGDRLLLE